MGLLFKDDFHDEFGTWPIAYIPYGGADFGEIQAVARAVGDGDDSAFYEAWMAAGDRLAAEAAAAAAAGRRVSARELFLGELLLRAVVPSALRRTGRSAPDRGLPQTDRRLRQGPRARGSSGRAAADPVRRHHDARLSLPAAGHADEVRPLLILTNGYDATVTDMYFASAVAASRRGYHCLLFDGPGQGEMLYEHGVRLRPDWETS